MNTNGLAKHYGTLSAEERFRLILDASGRGDDAERNRLANAGKRIAPVFPDHFPYALAFQKQATLTYIELLDAAGFYNDALSRADDAGDFDDTPATATKRKGKKATVGKPPWERCLNLALAAGFVLKVKADGWKLFCKRLNVPSSLMWQGYPGFDGLQSALAATEKAAFTTEGMLIWLNDARPPNDPKLTEVRLTVEKIASVHEDVFRWGAKWLGSDADALN